MKANEILLTATDTISERGLSYGHPSDNLQHTAMLLSAYLQTPIHDYQVAGIMVLVKLARTNQSAQHIDNWIDLYALQKPLRRLIALLCEYVLR